MNYNQGNVSDGIVNPCYCRPVVRLKEGAILTEKYGYYAIEVP